MRVRVVPFGVLKDWFGPSADPSAPSDLDLPAGSTVADLLDCLRSRLPAHAPLASLQGIAVSVNAEYAQATHVLHEGDEVGLLPPVSGGAPPTTSPARTANPLDENVGEAIITALIRQPINAAALAAAAKHPEDGAVVVFDGIVRNHSRGRRTLHLDYEAYEEMALRQMRVLSEMALERFAIRHVTLVHRLGRLQIGETSVLIVVASAHRSAAFEACRWLIDRLKQIVPIWKKETFADGAVWAPGEPFPAEIAINAAEVKPDA
jgi:MoaE-MoaD fusion protein